MMMVVVVVITPNLVEARVPARPHNCKTEGSSPMSETREESTRVSDDHRVPV